jgi:hypothetical protein
MCQGNRSNELGKTFEKARPSGPTGFLPPYHPEIEDLNHMLRKLRVLKSSTELQSLYLKSRAYKIIHFSVRGLLFLPIAFSLVASNQKKKKLNLLDFWKD